MTYEDFAKQTFNIAPNRYYERSQAMISYELLARNTIHSRMVFKYENCPTIFMPGYSETDSKYPIMGNTYTTKSYDSLKNSNVKWMWWGHGSGALCARNCF